jgi:hypothetical protein
MVIQWVHEGSFSFSGQGKIDTSPLESYAPIYSPSHLNKFSEQASFRAILSQTDPFLPQSSSLLNFAVLNLSISERALKHFSCSFVQWLVAHVYPRRIYLAFHSLKKGFHCLQQVAYLS